MKIKEKLIKICKNKIFIFVLILILIIVGIIIISLLRKNNLIKIFNRSEKEELNRIECEKVDFKLNDDYSYTYDCIIKFKELNGIEFVKYEKNGEEITLECNQKEKIAIDYKMHENEEYTFKVKPVNENERTEILKLERKVAGADTYQNVNGVYVNKPFIEDLNSKYTRYLLKTSNDTLTPGTWIDKQEPENWYSYREQNWANIYVEHEGVESYYVWIPRYMYKLDYETQRSDVKFVDVYNNYKNADTGEELTCDELIEQGYQLPEAFNFGDRNATAISGYWISKFQLSDLSKFKINYNAAASTNSIVLSNFTDNIGESAVKYTYAINGEIKNTTTQLNEYTFTGLEEGKTYVINVTALDDNDQILGSMTKIIEPAEVNPPDLSNLNPNTTYYVYWDDEGNIHEDTPISEPAPSNWYNYTYSKWANIVTKNNGTKTYFVWIPRYQYALNQTSQRSNVKFILGTGTETTNGYQIPEAFWFDKNDDGEQQDDEQLTGYWITKYILSDISRNLTYEGYVDGFNTHTLNLEPGKYRIKLSCNVSYNIESVVVDGNEIEATEDGLYYIDFKEYTSITWYCNHYGTHKYLYIDYEILN